MRPHAITDFDRDGFSGIFGGRDCAAFDARRFPGAQELPNNGIDENCDGEDSYATYFQAEVQPKFAGRSIVADSPYHVVWYIVDSLRADHLPVYGYPHNTSPALTELSREAWVFERAYSQSSTTALSVPSMFSGRNPLALHYKRNGFPIAGSDETYLSKVFSARGYLTAFITNDWVRDRLPGIRHGFEQVLASPPEAIWHSGDYLLESLDSLVEQAKDGGKPLFAVAHVDDVHHPYTAANGRTVPDFPSPGDQSAYDRGIALFDEGLSAFIEGLKRQQLWERTALIVTADHGEEFGEHGGTIHSRTCYDEVTHVPLIVRIPGEPAQRIKQPVALIDVAPTLLELLGGDNSSMRLDGQSLYLPVHEPDAVDPNRPIFCTIYQVMTGRQTFFTRAVRVGKWSFYEEALTARAELYGQARDPGEHNNLASGFGNDPIVADLRRLVTGTPEGNLYRVSQGRD